MIKLKRDCLVFNCDCLTEHIGEQSLKVWVVFGLGGVFIFKISFPFCSVNAGVLVQLVGGFLDIYKADLLVKLLQ